MHQGHGGFSNSDKVRTHMMFSSSGAPESKIKAKRGKREKHQSHHDANTQTIHGAIDPAEWTGNQRVLHFGPMGTRDQYYYFYPKGWDILYPAHFGFFPYRTKKYRGSRPTICLSAFGVYFCLGGAVMTYLGYLHPVTSVDRGFIEPLQIAGPVVLGLGMLFLLTGCCWWFCALHLFSEQLRHTQPHHAAPRRVVQYRDFTYEHEQERKDAEAGKVKRIYTLPPPPVPAIVANRNTSGTMYVPEAEMKLYPPSPSMLHPRSVRSAGGDYPGKTDTLRSYGTSSAQGSFVFENREAGEYHAAKPSYLIQDPLEAFDHYDRKHRVIGNPVAGKFDE